ncbi:MAG: hypothetical protein KC636_14940 [Myxococcales bacterium]|nr:hypothetical protein [Myxococcales bacterium]
MIFVRLIRCVGALVLPLAACTSAPPVSDTSDDTQTEPEPVVCASTPGDHATACLGPDCPITADVELRCDDVDFGAIGVRVAPAPDATYLATSSERDWFLFRADATSASVVEDLPKTSLEAPVLIALDPAGAVHLAAYDGDDASETRGIVHLHPIDGAWSIEPVGEDGSVLDFSFGPDGVANLWIERGGLPGEAHWLAQREAGAWSSMTLPTIGDYNFQFTRGADGELVSLGVRILDTYENQVLAVRDGVTSELGGINSSPGGFTSAPDVYRVTPPHPYALDPAEPPFVALIQDIDGYYFAWPAGDDYTLVELPDSMTLVSKCDFGEATPCHEPCHEDSAGVEHEAAPIAIARTADGVVWAAYHYRQRDRIVEFVERCTADGCLCGGLDSEDHGTHELRLARLVPDGSAPQLVLTLPLAGPADVAVDGTTLSWRSVDLAAFGTDLALAVRLREGPASAGMIRLLRIDTTRIPGA